MVISILYTVFSADSPQCDIAVLNGLGNVLELNVLAAVQVGNSPGYPENPVIAAGG